MELDPSALFTPGLVALGVIITKVFDYLTKRKDLEVTQEDKLRAEFKADLNVVMAEVNTWRSKYFEVYANLLTEKSNNLIIQEKYNTVTEKYNIATEQYNSLKKDHDVMLIRLKTLEGQSAGTIASNPTSSPGATTMTEHNILPTAQG